MTEEEYSRMYLEELMQIPVLDEEEMAKLLGRLPEPAAQERLISGNLAYVAGLAEEYVGKHADAADLIQEGNMALTLLVKNYKEGDFIRMRETAVRTAMQAYRDSQNRNDQLEEEVTAYINVLNRVTTSLAKELGREATLEEVAEKMKMPEDKIRILMKEAVNAVTTDQDRHQES